MSTRSTRITVIAAVAAVIGLAGQAAQARGAAGGRVAVARGGFGHSIVVRPSIVRPPIGFRGYGYRSFGVRGGYYGGLGAFGLGVFVGSLPYYRSTYWWNGVPYYYADDVYYRYNDSVRQYEKVTPPPGVTGQAAPGNATELFAYPRNGQSEAQQAADKAECRDWARQQTAAGASEDAGTASREATPPDASGTQYLRAETACLEGRGYTVK